LNEYTGSSASHSRTCREFVRRGAAFTICLALDDMLAEIDTHKFEVSRHFVLTKDKEMGMTGAPHGQMKMGELTCVPTWARPSNDGEEVYVACNKPNDIAVIDVASWKLSKRFSAGNGVYNLAMTKDGRLIATNKRGRSVSIFDPKTGKELANLPTKRKVVHGAVVTPDNHVDYAGSEPHSRTCCARVIANHSTIKRSPFLSWSKASTSAFGS
jgi:WD40 repeat protein